nr:RHS repeat-associated core domain-containing protein [uncultured Pseudomonas sp.]
MIEKLDEYPAWGTKNMLIFYKGEHPVSLMGNGIDIRYVVVDRNTLCVKESGHHALYACDSQHSPVSIRSTQSTTTLKFQPFGHDTGLCTKGFKGERRDVLLQSYHLGNGYRVYCPSLARFLQTDRFSPFLEGGVNAYAFAGNDPVNHWDPTGRFTQPIDLIVTTVRKIFTHTLKTLMWPVTKKSYQGRILMGGDDFTVFSRSGNPTGTDTLYIDAHGSPGVIYKGKHAFDAATVNRKIKRKGISLKNRNVHVLACQSAVPDPKTGQSFIQDLARITGKQVSGYDDSVWTYSFAPHDSAYHDLIKIYAPPGMGTSSKTTVSAIRKS